MYHMVNTKDTTSKVWIWQLSILHFGDSESPNAGTNWRDPVAVGKEATACWCGGSQENPGIIIVKLAGKSRREAPQ